MKKNIIYLIIGFVIAGFVSYVIAEIYIDSLYVIYESDYTDKTNVKDALDELFNDLDLVNQGNASAANILKGKTAVVGKNLITGSMPNNGTVTKSIQPGTSYTIAKGYHSGSGTISALVETIVTKVWTNTSPTSNFASQTVNFNTTAPSDTTAYIIKYKREKGGTLYHYAIIFKGSTYGFLSGADGNYTLARVISTSSLTSISFGESYAGVTVFNNYLIPTDIWAIKNLSLE